MAEVLYLDRNRFRALPGAEARQTAPNVWEVEVPRDAAVRRILRGEVTAEAFDGSLWEVDGVESIQALGTAERRDTVTVLLP